MHQLPLLGDVLPPQAPLVVAYGMGVDSTALLIGLAQRGVRPDLILFADTGGEKPETYLYAPIIQQWLRDVGFPQLQVVRYTPRFADYDTLYGNCRQNETLPSPAFGRKSCSLKWKRQPQDHYVRHWAPAQAAWSAGLKVRKLIGFDAGESPRRYADRGDDPHYENWYPLMDWGWDRPACRRIIADVGLPVPVKSACFFCPAMKKPEIVQLAVQSPDLMDRALTLEDGFRQGKHWRGDLGSTRGLGRRFAWREFAAQRGLRADADPHPGVLF